MAAYGVQWGGIILIGYSFLLFAVLLVIDAPYGKRDADGWGPGLPVRWAWALLEAPSLLVPLYVLAQHRQLPGLPGAILLGLWLLHYSHRTLIYPFTIRPKPGATFKWVMIILGAPMNAAIAWLITQACLQLPHLQQPDWLSQPQFGLGLALFIGGMALTKHADASLAALRKNGDNGYHIPYGGAYRYVSCPNYLGEILQWFGLALAAWALPMLGFAFYTAANLIPRALTSHRWYHETFAAYPSDRKAVIPGLL